MECSSRKSVLMVVSVCVLVFGIIFSTFIASQAYFKTKYNPGTVTVTGSAKKELKSDLAVWSGTFYNQAKTLPEAYKLLKSSQEQVKQYLISKNVKEQDITISAVNTMINYTKNFQGMFTSDIESYRLSQNVELKSTNVDMIEKLARESTELIDKGIEFQSNFPQYFYTKIADLKVDMLALATKDAKARAEQIANNSNSKIDGLKYGRMGVFQITPKYSNTISDYGIDDTSSIDKQIMAVVNCDFRLK